MKHLLLSYLVLALLTIHPIYGYEVPTNVQKRNILLEEFTGISCGNCPDGHLVAKTLQKSHPDNIYVVAIHSGHYAEPFEGAPDFRIDAGEELDAYFEAYNYGYPGGMINRHKFEGEPLTVFNRGAWIKSAKAIHQEDALVNLSLTSSFDAQNRLVNIQIEGYCPMDVSPNLTPMLSVLWTQSNILGYQNGGGAGNEYNHAHMLRGYVTPTFGELIENFGKETYFQKTYTFNLPTDIKGIEVKPEDIEIIAFVSDGQGEILNVTGGKPTYSNYEKQLAAEISLPKIPIGTRYGYNFFELNIENHSSQTLTHASFDININEEALTSEWTGEIAPFSSKEITIKVSPYTILSKNKYSIQLKTLNEQSVTPSTINGEFANPVETVSAIIITLQTDLYADENTFCLKDAEGNVIREFGPYESNLKKEYQEPLNLSKNQIYCFEIKDEWGDGIQQGYLKIHTENKKLVAQEYSIKDFGVRSFFKTSNETSIASNKLFPLISYDPISRSIHAMIDSNLPMDISLYSISGKKILDGVLNYNSSLKVPSLPQGIYLLQWKQATQTGVVKLNIQ